MSENIIYPKTAFLLATNQHIKSNDGGLTKEEFDKLSDFERNIYQRSQDLKTGNILSPSQQTENIRAKYDNPETKRIEFYQKSEETSTNNEMNIPPYALVLIGVAIGICTVGIIYLLSRYKINVQLNLSKRNEDKA